MGKSKKYGNPLGVCIIGTGYVGLVTAACLAEIGHSVIGVDNNKEKIKKLKKGISPIYEEGLEALIQKHRKTKHLTFTSDIEKGVVGSEIIFIAVHTPTKKSGATDLSFVESVAKKVAQSMNAYKIIVSKSTMPVETGKHIKNIITKYHKPGLTFDIVSNPEFLREGTAVKDFLYPDRIVIGAETKKAERTMRQLYQPIHAPLLVTGIEAAEIIKHACNAFLAMKISFINAVAQLCEKVGANVEEVAYAMGLDRRIVPSFLHAGIGYGGSCFPKDIAAFYHISKKHGYDFKLLRVVEKINQAQRTHFVRKVSSALGGKKSATVGILGLAFKPNTDDMRNAPSLDIIHQLLKKGMTIQAYDPAARERAKEIFKGKIAYCDDAYQAAKGADALLLLTEWQEFKDIDLKKVKSLLRSPLIIDGRNVFNPEKMKSLGFRYVSIGRPSV